MPASHGLSPRPVQIARHAGCLALAAALGAAMPLFAQTAPATAPTVEPAPTGLVIAPAAPSTSPAAVVAAPSTAPATHPAPAAATPEVPAITQPFVATVTSDHVNVRSGPATINYEIGQLNKGDLVYVVGVSKGWYQILPPNGTFCMIAKEFVEADNAGGGTVTSEYVNVRAGTATNKNRDPSAVLTVVRKGTKLKILGSTDKYYEIAPPERSYVYVSPQFVKQTTAEYQVPDLKLPAGAVGPSQTVVAPNTPPSAAPPVTGTIEIPNGGQAPSTEPAAMVEGGTPAQTQPAVPVPVPAVTFSETATQKFNELNARYQEEGRKPLAQQNVDDLLKEYKALLTMDNLSPSVKLGSDSRISALEKVAAIQRLSKENEASNDSLAKQREALQQQYSEAERAIAEYQKTSPFVAEGMLRSSTIVQGKYALVNPATGRVVAYIDPKSDVDVGKLVGNYVGVRGSSEQVPGTEITLIKVSNATLMPAPATGPAQQ